MTDIQGFFRKNLFQLLNFLMFARFRVVIMQLVCKDYDKRL